MKQPLQIDSGTYEFDVLIFIGNTDKQVFNYINKIYELDTEEKEALIMKNSDDMHARTCMLRGGQMIMRFNKWKNDTEFISLLVHETHHLVQFLFDEISLEYSTASHEAWAYQHQYYFKEIYKKLKQ